MRVLPNMKVIVPCDAVEAKKATIAAAKIWGPIYIRLAREKRLFLLTKKHHLFRKAEVFTNPESRKSRLLVADQFYIVLFWRQKNWKKKKSEPLL